MNTFKIFTTLLILSASALARRDDYKKIVSDINRMKVSWTADLFENDFDYDNDVELAGRLGAIPESGSKRTLQRIITGSNTTSTTNTSAVVSAANPASLDLRLKYPKCSSLTTIRNQGSCGSCWAFSSMNTLSDRYCISKSTANSVAQRSFSVEDVMECCANCSVPGKPCSGGMPGAAFNYVKASGVSTGEAFGNTTQCKPYYLNTATYTNLVPTFTCKKTCSNTSINYATDLVNITGVASGRGVAQMVAELNKGGTIVGSFAVYQDFYNYKSGVYYKVTGSLLGYHAVRIIGYGTDATTKTDFWLIANSWGPNWGEKGYFRMRKGTDEGGI